MAERLFQERKDRLGDILKIASDATPAPAEQAVKPAGESKITEILFSAATRVIEFIFK